MKISQIDLVAAVISQVAKEHPELNANTKEFTDWLNRHVVPCCDQMVESFEDAYNKD